VIFSTFYYTHHSCVCVVTSYIGNEIVGVIKMFPVATKLTPFWKYCSVSIDLTFSICVSTVVLLPLIVNYR
jgi:hypothetical protein